MPEIRYLADENIDDRIVHAIDEAGYKIRSVRNLLPGVSDEEVINETLRMKEVLITSDKDFGEMVFRYDSHCPGVILLRLAGIDAHDQIERILEFLQRAQKDIMGSFIVISSQNVRIRKMR